MNAALPAPVVGRFAPSPSGPLHFGSLIAAVGSFLQARAQGGQWRLRIDDLDAPRTRVGAETDILRTLEAFGFAWDGAIARQSDAASQARYQAAFAQLREMGAVYGCACTRRDLADAPRARDGARRYPGTCRAGLPAGLAARAFRVRVHGEVEFLDGVQGRQTENLAEDCGDFIVARADGVFAYQLAVVLDDAAQSVTEVVRGADLLASTGRQIFLHRLLGLPVPVYAHLPMIVNRQGKPYSQTNAGAAAGCAPRARTTGRRARLPRPPAAHGSLPRAGERTMGVGTATLDTRARAAPGGHRAVTRHCTARFQEKQKWSRTQNAEAPAFS